MTYGSGVWNDSKIAAWAAGGGVTPFDAELVNPASLDLRLGDLIRVPDKMWKHLSKIDMQKHIDNGTLSSLRKWSEPIKFSSHWLYHGDFVLCHSLELVRIPPSVASILVLKSSRGRDGFNHSHSGWGDPGFGYPLPQSVGGDGDGASWTFELQNIAPWPIELVAGAKIIQMVMFDMADVPDVDYRHTGNYVYQTGPTPAKV